MYTAERKSKRVLEYLLFLVEKNETQQHIKTQTSKYLAQPNREIY